MLTKQTVFLIGAGASNHYFYPTGNQLIQWLLRYCSGNSAVDGEKGISYFNVKLKQILKDEFDKEIIDNFFQRLRLFQSTNIDNFLLYNPSFEKLGKIIISSILYCLETDYFFSGQKNIAMAMTKFYGEDFMKNRIDSEYSFFYSLISDDFNIPANYCWMELLFAQIIENCADETQVINSFNNAKFITFNYDLSLERFLLDRITNSELLNRLKDEIYKPLENIVHCYGSLYEVSEVSKKYGSTFGNIIESIYRAKNLDSNMSLIAGKKLEERRVLPEIQKAIKWLNDSRNIYILGFGFDDYNCKLLDLRDAVSISKEFVEEVKKRKLSKESFPDIRHYGKKIYYTDFNKNKRAKAFFEDISEDLAANESKVYSSNSNVYDFFEKEIYLR